MKAEAGGGKRIGPSFLMGIGLGGDSKLTMMAETLWEIPEPLAICEVAVDYATTIQLRRHGNPAGPRLVLSHGNGLAVDLYYPFWSLLLDDFDLVLFDLRNHGWNGVGNLQQHNIPTFRQDLDRILQAIDHCFGTKEKIGVFHSVSALVALLACERNHGFSALVLFDPPLCNKLDESHAEFEVAVTRLAKRIRSRTPRFQSREEFIELLEYMPIFRRAVAGVPDLVARTTLRPTPNGKEFELRCPPAYEAQIIDYARAFAVLVDFELLACPAKIVGADPTLSYSYLPTFNLDDMVAVDYDFLPETTHLLQLEQPHHCVAVMREFLELHNLA